jgi:ubiquinone/menaquinone biosynthesis C-methylase UbiE
MAHGHKFDVKKLDRLRDPERLKYLNPDKIWGRVGEGEVDTLVDIGAGIGFFAIPFARKMPAGKVYACDLSEEMIGHLAEAAATAGVDNVVPVKTEEVRVPLEDGVADVVLMVNLHHELDHPEESLAESRRLLREGGRLAIIDWKPEATPSGPPVHVRIPPDRVEQQLSHAGFADIVSHPLLPYHYLITSRKPA